MNGLTLVALLAAAVAIALAWRAGVASGRRAARSSTGSALRPTVIAPAPRAAVDGVMPPTTPRAGADNLPDATVAPAMTTGEPRSAGAAARAPSSALLEERARIVRSLDRENARLAHALADARAQACQLADLAEDRRRLLATLADVRAEAARYRTLVVDLENNAPPPLLDGPDAPDDLRLIVGVGPVLARMLQQLGISTYRQIARWSERDIDEFDARLPEFPGRIRRDGWVTQARALHQAKYGETLPVRER